MALYKCIIIIIIIDLRLVNTDVYSQIYVGYYSLHKFNARPMKFIR